MTSFWKQTSFEIPKFNNTLISRVGIVRYFPHKESIQHNEQTIWLCSGKFLLCLL